MESVVTRGVTISGIDGIIVNVELIKTDGLPGLDISGLPAVYVKEVRHRVRSAMRAGGYEWSTDRMFANFAPADLPKHGTALDLPLAVAFLTQAGVIDASRTDSFAFYGELALDGSIRPVPGAICAALAVRKAGLNGIFLAPENAAEAATITGIDVLAPRSLVELVEYLAGRASILPSLPSDRPPVASRFVDLAAIRGQPMARRALEVAAAGGHNMLFVGPPGCGKTLLARALPGILPPLTPEESIETTRIHSISGLTGRNYGVMTAPPFRAPHPTASEAALIGGGNPPMPGEVSLAHRGVLFLDEAAEFRRASLDALSGPLKERAVTIQRSRKEMRIPSAAMVVMATNPCPCGHFGDTRRACKCTPAMVRSYQQRLNGPLLDSVAIRVEISVVDSSDLAASQASESSSLVQARVIVARKRQLERNGGVLNSELTPDGVEKVAPLNASAERFLARCGKALNISAARHQILALARTIADLNGDENVVTGHLAEALSYTRGSHV